MNEIPPIEMKFCRRCGAPLTNTNGHVYTCEQGHTIFNNASPAVGIILYNDQNEVMVIERGIEPGLGKLDAPGGFCDGLETYENAARREISEEVGITSDQYGPFEFLLSETDPYSFGGELLPVLSVMFKAKITGSVKPVPADDAAAVHFIPARELNLEDIYFSSVRRAYQKFAEDLDK